MTDGLRIGIDIGGTKIAAVILDEAGREQARYRISMPHDYGATVANVANVVYQLESQAGPAASIGISMPGVMNDSCDPLLVSNLPWLEGKPFSRDLEQALDRQIQFGNDANCFALSEAVDGAAAGAAVVFGVILGTGVGGGIVVDGKLMTGANGTAGEWGHNPLPWCEASDGAKIVCGCGQIGCIETWLNGAALSRDYHSMARKYLTGKEIVQLANKGNALACKAISRYESRLARALSAAINFLDPDVIVLGGGLSTISSLYECVPQIWSRHASSGAAKATRLIAAAHGADSGVRGAAWL